MLANVYAQGNAGIFVQERTILHLRMEGANGGSTFTDSSLLKRPVTVGGATTSTAQVKCGTSSGLFVRASSQYLTLPEGLECVIRADDEFTAQGWVYFNSTPPAPSNTYTLLSVGGANVSYAHNFAVGWNRNDGLSRSAFFLYAGGGYMIFGSTPSTLTWIHWAVCKYRAASGGALTHELWLNGASQGTSTTGGTNYGIAEVDGTGTTGVGCYVAPTSGARSEYADCYQDEIQVINGTALYRDSVSFTPPAKEL